MNPRWRELWRWLRCPHRGTSQTTYENGDIAWQCDDCGLSRIRWSREEKP